MGSGHAAAIQSLIAARPLPALRECPAQPNQQPERRYCEDNNNESNIHAMHLALADFAVFASLIWSHLTRTTDARHRPCSHEQQEDYILLQRTNIAVREGPGSGVHQASCVAYVTD